MRLLFVHRDLLSFIITIQLFNRLDTEIFRKLFVSYHFKYCFGANAQGYTQQFDLMERN
jgi:hypothetical protein